MHARATPYGARGDVLLVRVGLGITAGRFFVPDYRPDGLVLMAVPEPGTCALLVAGLGLLAWTVRRGRRAPVGLAGAD